jgi:Bbp16
MILDGFLQFSSAQTLALAAGTYTSTNIIDLGLSGLPTSASGGGARDIGIGDDPAMKLLVQVVTAFTSAGSPTLFSFLQGAPDNGSGAPGAFTTMLTGPTVAFAQLQQVGTRILDDDMPRPVPAQPLPRFLQLSYTIGAATVTAGNVSAFLVLDRHDLPEQSNAVLGGYPPGITIAN